MDTVPGRSWTRLGNTREYDAAVVGTERVETDTHGAWRDTARVHGRGGSWPCRSREYRPFGAGRPSGVGSVFYHLHVIPYGHCFPVLVVHRGFQSDQSPFLAFL